jgi:hypothetical protein
MGTCDCDCVAEGGTEDASPMAEAAGGRTNSAASWGACPGRVRLLDSGGGFVTYIKRLFFFS